MLTALEVGTAGVVLDVEDPAELRAVAAAFGGSAEVRGGERGDRS